MIRGKLQGGIRTMLDNLHVRRNSTDSPNAFSGSGSTPGGSPRTEVGEIDTSAPFESVRAAVTKFGSTSPSGAAAATSSQPYSLKKAARALDDQRVLEKETQIHLALKQLEDLKDRLKHSEATKAQAIRDLDQANNTLQDLTNRLDAVSESKQAAIQCADAAKQRAMEVEQQKAGSPDARKQDADNNEREAYRATTGELISAKQELTMLRRDFDVALERKLAGFQQAVDVQQASRVNQERAAQMSKEIASLQETREQVKQATLESQLLQNQHVAEREARLASHWRAKEEVDLRMKALREEERGVQSGKVMEEKMEETSEAVMVMEEQLREMKESDSSALKDAAMELEGAKKKLEEIREEEKQHGSVVNEVQGQVDNMKWELGEMRGKTMEAENRVGNLEALLQGYRAQLQGGEAVDPGEASACDGMAQDLQQLRAVSEGARREEEEIRRKIAQLREETQAACVKAREAEERLKVAAEELEEAKAAAERSRGMIHAEAGGGEGKMIKLWVEEFGGLSRRGEELTADADVKVATIMAQIESIEGSEKEALKKQEAIRVERESVENAIMDAVKQAEMAEAANKVVEAELIRWRRRESHPSTLH